MTLRTQQQHKNWRAELKQSVTRLSWLLHDHVVGVALILSILGTIAIILGLTIAHLSALQGTGGIVFGTGLTVLLSQMANRQQLAKDANLRRKTDVYGPLHAELQTLRERLEATREGSQPYLQWIDVLEMTFPVQQFAEKPPQLRSWSAYKADFHSSLDFLEPTRLLLNQVHQYAIDYNRAINDALAASLAILTPAIDAAITRTASSEAFRQWDKDHPSGLVSGSSSWSSHDWSVRIQLALATPPVGLVWVTTWLSSGPGGYYRPPTLGWLLAENSEQAMHCILTVCNTPAGSYPSPPHEWLQAIFEEVWQTLQSHPTYTTVRRLHEELFKQVSQAEAKLLNTLRDLQNIYEGGPPLL